MITTRESISYQFSLIFGYSSPDELTVGNVVGSGNLTKENVNELSQNVIKFLRMYNALLRDYMGSEVYCIEFELFNYEKRSSQIKIFPKSMVLTPGIFKDCESLMLAMKPETGFLDPHKSRESINDISRLFYEVEEFSHHPELPGEKRVILLKKFANRFSNKLFSELLEDKWNKKLVGLTTSLPTDEDKLNSYGSIRKKIDYLWNKYPHEVVLSQPKFQSTLNFRTSNDINIERLKYIISEPSVNFVADKTFELGINLLDLANTGTVDVTLDKIVKAIIRDFDDLIPDSKKIDQESEILTETKVRLNELEKEFTKYMTLSREFISTGKMGNLNYLLQEFEIEFKKNTNLLNERYGDFIELIKFSITQSITDTSNLRANDLDSAIRYFSELVREGFNIVLNATPKYMARLAFKGLTLRFIGKLLEKLSREELPVKNLGQNILNKLMNYLNNLIELSPSLNKTDYRYDQDSIIRDFKKLIRENTGSFLNDISLSISDISSFAEVQMENDPAPITNHIQSFKNYSRELSFLLSYILRYSTINRFIKTEEIDKISDPVMFATKFYRFLEKRMGGMYLAWKSLILSWITDYSKKFLKIEEQRNWTLIEIYSDFLGYLEQRERNQREPKAFLMFLDTYIAGIKDQNEKELLLDFYKQFETSIDIGIEFPKYILQKIEKEVNITNFDDEIHEIFKSLNDLSSSFYSYINETELKYYSKLIARPVSLILKHKFSDEENERFIQTLKKVLNR